MACYSPSPIPVPHHYHSHGSAYRSGPSLSSATHKARGHRLCDTCGRVETSETGRFRLCGGCLVTQYCSPECQKKNWPQHKQLCQHTADQVAATKKHAISLGHSSDLPDEDLPKYLRKFTSIHADLIGWAVFQALQLKRIPSNIRQYALNVQLSYRSTPDSARRFAVVSAELVPRSLLEKTDPLIVEDVMRRETRCRRAGGIGVAVVILQCGLVSQVMPVEVDPPAKIGWDVREDWEQVMRMYIDAGRVDFQAPISMRR